MERDVRHSVIKTRQRKKETEIKSSSILPATSRTEPFRVP